MRAGNCIGGGGLLDGDQPVARRRRVHQDAQGIVGEGGQPHSVSCSRRSIGHKGILTIDLCVTTFRIEPPLEVALTGVSLSRWTMSYFAAAVAALLAAEADRKSTRLNSSHYCASRMPSSA